MKKTSNTKKLKIYSTKTKKEFEKLTDSLQALRDASLIRTCNSKEQATSKDK